MGRVLVDITHFTVHKRSSCVALKGTVAELLTVTLSPNLLSPLYQMTSVSVGSARVLQVITPGCPLAMRCESSMSSRILGATTIGTKKMTISPTEKAGGPYS